MGVPARVDYAVRALLALAAVEPAIVNARMLADTQQIPAGYLYEVLADLRRADLVYARMGHHGGYALTRPAAEITLGGVLRLLRGAPGAVLDAQPSVPPGERETLAARLRRLWDAADAASLGVLDELSLADVVSDRIPRRVRDLIP